MPSLLVLDAIYDIFSFMIIYNSNSNMPQFDGKPFLFFEFPYIAK